MAMAKCGAFVELLDMAARIAVRSYTHLPQTSRAYYKPPTTTTTSTTTTAKSNRGASASGRSSYREAEASSAMRNQQQHVAAVRVALDATEIILVGGV